MAEIKEIVGHAYRDDRQYNIVSGYDEFYHGNYYDLVFKSDVGDEEIGYFWQKSKDHYRAYFRFVDPDCFYGSVSESGVIKWLLDKHAEWLDKQFEIAFNEKEQPTHDQ